jgi:8-oxo-dGTP pyrophosphatase MutT (NUDIX family)
MASLGLGNYVVVILHVGGFRASNIRLVLQREPCTGKTWFPASLISPNKEPFDVAVREFFEEIGLTLTVDDCAMLRNKPVRVALLEGKHHIVYDFSVIVPVPYVTTNSRTPVEVSQAVIAHATINLDVTYVLPKSIDIDGISLTPSKVGLLPAAQRKFELLHFGYVAQWEAFRDEISKHMFSHDDTSLQGYFGAPFYNS